jgi:hypothetical protein
MRDQNLFEALQNVCNFTALESDMDEIKRAIEKDKTPPTFPECVSDDGFFIWYKEQQYDQHRQDELSVYKPWQECRSRCVSIFEENARLKQQIEELKRNTEKK